MTSNVHSIRLRGPWDYQVLWAADGSSHSPGRVKMPCDWSESLGPAFCGRVRYWRTFNRPTNLAAGQRVWLVVDGVHASAEVALNGRSLGRVIGDERARFDAAALLASHNELIVEVELAPGSDGAAAGEAIARPGGLVGEVRLEIAPAEPA